MTGMEGGVMAGDIVLGIAAFTFLPLAGYALFPLVFAYLYVDMLVRDLLAARRCRA